MPSIIALVLSILLTAWNPAGHKPAGTPSPTPNFNKALKARALKAYGALPMSFEINQGQADRTVRFLARGQGYAIFLNPTEAVLALQPSVRDIQVAEKAGEPGAQPSRPTHILKMKIEGSDPSATVTGLQKLPGISNYFVGNDPSRWRTNIPTYAKVQFENVRPGVNLVYYGNQGQLEYDFVLSRGVRPEFLGLSFEGSGATVDAQGDLVFTSTDGKVTFRRPVAYQLQPPDTGKKHFLFASYVLKGHNRVGFVVPNYDPREPLVIDPVLNYSTYLGGNGGDTGNAIALDTLNDAFVTGSTASTNFPTKSPYQPGYGGSTDAFVTKLRYDGEVVLYSTYVGGNNYDVGNGISVDSSGDAYITGSTMSSNFPTTSNVFQTALAGNSNAFVSKLDPSGSHLLYSSFLGGNTDDYGLAIAVDEYGNAYITGSTDSTNFPTCPSQLTQCGATGPVPGQPIQSGYSGDGDAFVAEVNQLATALVYSTYLGGSSADVGQGITVDAGGAAYVVGYTYSTNFPTYNAYQASNAGSVDAFISKISPGGLTFAFSTYLGGTGDDRGKAIAIDGQLNIYVTGSTLTACTPASTTTTMCNPTSTFPTSADAYQTYALKESPGYADVFVTKLNFPGNALIYSTLLGGALTDSGAGIAVDGAGNAYVTGYTQSNNFPTATAVQASYVGGTCGSSPCPDAFITEVSPLGSALVSSTYLGGSTGNWGNGIALDGKANAYVVGTTDSSNFPAITLSYQTAPGNTTGLGNAFVSMLSHNDASGVALTPQTLNFGNVNEDTSSTITSQGFPAVVTLTNVGTVPLQVTSVSIGGDFTQTNNCVGTVSAGGGSCTINLTFTPTALVAETEELTIEDNNTTSGLGSPHGVIVTGTGINELTQVLFTPQNLVFGTYTIGKTSPPQIVTMINDGTTPLTITNIATTGDFAETNDCPVSTSTTGTVTLPINGTCTFDITFTPTTSGARTGSVVVTDNVPSGSSTIPLAGTGNPLFNLTSNTLTENIPIGTAVTQFTISLTAPSTFTDTITLSCTGSSTACAFSSNTIALGQPTIPTFATMTLENLSSTTQNPLTFTVSGTDTTTGIGTAALNLTIYLEDFGITANPAVNSVTSGGATIYTASVTPLNGFGKAVAIGCVGTLPPATTCLANPAAVSPNGGAVTSQVTIATTAQSTAVTSTVVPPRLRPRMPPGPKMMLILLGASYVMALAALLVRRNRGLRATGRRRRFVLAQLALATLILATAFWASCDDYVYTNVIQPTSVNGTPTGNYVITIQGTYTGLTSYTPGISGSTVSVSRHTTVNLTVQ